MPSSPVVAGGKLYIGSGSFVNNLGSLLVFDAAGETNCSGTPKVCSPLWGETVIGNVRAAPAVANGVVYAADDRGGLAAVDAEGPSSCKGAPRCPLSWSADTGAGAAGSPAVVGGVVYVGNTNGKVLAYDAAGETNCRLTPSGNQFCDPLWTATTDSAISRP